MAVPTPEELYSSMIDELMQDPNAYDTEPESDDYEVVATPDEVKDGSFTAKLTLKPTSTTNPSRPRTVAAGYDRKMFVLTVVFPDGTWYNYYDVPENMWNEFKSAESKGRYMNMSGLDSWPDKGEANVGEMSVSRRAALNSVVASARKAQQAGQGIQGRGESRGKVVTINGQQYRL
jgi:hypothetical protein